MSLASTSTSIKHDVSYSMRPGSFIGSAHGVQDVFVESRMSTKDIVETKGESAPLAAALAIDKPKLWSRQMRRLYLVCFLAYLSRSLRRRRLIADSCINGFDGSVMTGINSINAYLDYFQQAGIGSGTGIVFAMFSIAQLFGSFVAGMQRNLTTTNASGPASDRWGRRVGMAIGSVIIICGTAIQATSVVIAQFMVGRFCVGFGVSIIATAAPTYVVEMAHPAWRGAFTGAYNICNVPTLLRLMEGWYLGSIVAAWTTYGTSQTMDSSFAWRIPVALQAAPSCVVLAFVMLLPETPRWLVSVGRRQDARAVLAKYHADNEPQSPIVKLEMYEIDEHCLLDGSDKRWWDYRALFNSRNARYRSFMVVCIAFFGQWSGNAIVSQWFPNFLRRAGVPNNKVLLYNSLDPVLCLFAALVSPFSIVFLLLARCING
jgi:MFS family permease